MNILTLNNTAIIDTETTGLDTQAQIVEVSAICGESGDVLFHSLVKPLGYIPQAAQNVHGITNDMVKHAPSWENVVTPLVESLGERSVIIYNADYDARLVVQSWNIGRVTHDGRPKFESQKNLSSRMRQADCAMNWYAEFFGEQDHYRGGFKWQSLTNAARQQGVNISDLDAHRATADCEITRRLIQTVNQKLQG